MSWVNLNALNNFLNIWFEFCSRQSQNRTEIIISQIRTQLSLVHVHYKNVCSHKYVLPNYDKTLQAKSLTLPYVLELRLP